MSKTFLCDEPVRPTGCFCQDCIAELEVQLQTDTPFSSSSCSYLFFVFTLKVPLTFKLQFLEEAAEEKRKIKKGGRKVKEIKKEVEVVDEDESNRIKLDGIVQNHRKELRNFWASISIEEKWCLTEMSTTELSDILSWY